MSNRSLQLWEFLSQMFGAEALAKKYGEEPPPLWAAEVDKRPDYALERGIRRLKHSGMQHIPTLPQFLKLCDDLGGQGEYAGDDYAHGFDAPRLPERYWSRWELEGNLKLLSYVRNMGKACHPDSTYDPIKHQAKPGPIGTRITQRLVAAKNAWVEDMTAEDKGESVPRERQLEAWNEIMGYAEADISKMRSPL